MHFSNFIIAVFVLCFALPVQVYAGEQQATSDVADVQSFVIHSVPPSHLPLEVARKTYLIMHGGYAIDFYAYYLANDGRIFVMHSWNGEPWTLELMASYNVEKNGSVSIINDHEKVIERFTKSQNVGEMLTDDRATPRPVYTVESEFFKKTRYYWRTVPLLTP